MLKIEPGSTVIFKTTGKKQLGIILTINKNKCQIFSSEEKKVKTSTSKIFLSLENNLKLEKFNEKQLSSFIKNIDIKADELITSINIREIYDLICDEEKGFSVMDIAELCFPEPLSPEQILATLKALSNDNIYFKEKSELFYPKEHNEVKEILKQIKISKQKAEEKLQQKIMAIEWIKATLSNSEIIKTDPESNIPAYVQKYIMPLKQFIIDPDENTKKHEANLIINEISQHTDYSFQSNLLESIFNILVKLGIFQSDQNIALLKYQIPTSFPKEAVNEAKNIINSLNEQSLSQLNDLTDILTFTIDDEETSDIDDAISCETLNDNQFKVHVHISNVSYYINDNSILDQEALKRGTTVYLPDGKISMFPPELSDNVMSLLPGKISPVLTFEILFDKNAEILEKKIYESKILVNHKLNYISSSEILENQNDPNLFEPLSNLYFISSILKRKRIESGAVQLESDDIKIKISESGEIIIKKSKTNTPAHCIIQEFMILCNSLAADFCLINNIPAFYFSQPSPDEEIQLIPGETLTRDQRFEILKKFRKSEICLSPSSHFSLGVKSYTQATSPIRRYHDLIIHRQIKSHLENMKPPYDINEIQKIAATAEQTTRCTQLAERETSRYWMLKYYKDKKGQIFSAIVLRKLTNSYLVELEDTYAQAILVSGKNLYPGTHINVKIENVKPFMDNMLVRLAKKEA